MTARIGGGRGRRAGVAQTCQALGDLPAELPADVQVIGLFVADFHQRWPWSERRWRFAGQRMSALASTRWHGSAEAIGTALAAARRVRTVDEPHLACWLPQWAQCHPTTPLFPPVARRCDSFSQWWTRTTKGLALVEGRLVPGRPQAR